jgi:hypothetical protein
MEGLAFGLGILLAIFGPLLLMPLTWLVYRFVVRQLVMRLLPPSLAGGAGWLLSACIVAAALAISYFPGKWRYDRLCAERATPEVSARVRAEGFFRSRLYPYEAARWLETFAWVEAPDLYEDGVHVRYSKAGDEVRQEQINALRSRYGVREDFSESSDGILITEKTVYEMASGHELARATNILYQGGPLALFLGSWAMSSCPDILTEQGSKDFRTFYDLETIVLHTGALSPAVPSR